VLHLQAGPGDDPLVGHLEISSLDNVARCNEDDYVALLYVWGGPVSRNMIKIDATSFHCKLSVAQALRNVRRKSSTLRIWVDSICINQADMSVRGHQVQIMLDIYRSATSVLVWLGLSEPDSEAGINILKTLVDDHGMIARPQWQTLDLQLVAARLRDIMRRS
jgi:hypothetical protein